MKKIALLVIIFFSTSTVFADDFTAKVCYLYGGKLGVRPIGDTFCYHISFVDSVTTDDFSNLMPGDGLTFTGQRKTSINLEIESISTVGLYRLVGKWKDDQDRYYSFSSFSDVTIYDPNTVDGNKTSSFSYELYPNSALRWGILLSGQTEHVGLLRQFADKSGQTHFEICLYEDNLPTRRRVCSTLSAL